MADINFTVHLDGDANLEAAIRSALSAFSADLAGPLVEEAETIMAASKAIVPVLSGDLRASGDVVGINVEDNGDSVDVVFGYGGIASSYAVMQHETPPEIFSHTEPTQWKYLERPVLEAVQGFGPRIAERLRKRFSGNLPSDGGTFD